MELLQHEYRKSAELKLPQELHERIFVPTGDEGSSLFQHSANKSIIFRFTGCCGLGQVLPPARAGGSVYPRKHTGQSRAGRRQVHRGLAGNHKVVLGPHLAPGMLISRRKYLCGGAIATGSDF